MKSKLFLEEEIKNQRKSSAAAEIYYPCKIILSDGKERYGLFTKGQILVALNRASKNPEDIPQTWLDRLFSWFKK